MVERNCPVCGRNFVRSAKHLYKEGKRLFCSWTCYIHRDEDDDAPRAVEQYTEHGRAKRTYRSVDEAAAIMDGRAIDIVDACINCTFYKGYLWRYKDDVS